MLIELYTIRDVQAEAYGKIFMFQNENMAKRTFHASLLNNDDTMGTFPADFVLYAIGVYDDQSGLVTPQDPVRVCTGPEILAKRAEDMVKIESLQTEIANLNGQDNG